MKLSSRTLSITFLLIFLSFNSSLFAQAVDPNNEDVQSQVFNIPGLELEPIGGIENLYNNLEYPSMARRMGISGTVFVEFVINKNGEVEAPKVLRGIGAGCDEAAVEAIKKLSYEPYVHRGKTVAIKYSMPVKFE